VTTLLLAAVIAQATGEMSGASTANIEPRPPSAQLSQLQGEVDALSPGGTLFVEPGVYNGDLYLDRPVRLVGRGRPTLVGSGAGSVVLIRAADVTIEGFDIDGRGGGDLGRDSSGIHVAAPRAIVRDCRIANTLFGVYIREAPGTRVERCRIRGIEGKAAGEKGSGIHVWNTDGFTLEGNDIAAVRDGIYIQSSPHGHIRGNVARDLRYGLHYMYSDDNEFEGNTFENGAAGTAVMYSRRLTFRRNRFIRNRGFASVGLLLKTCDDVLAEHNLIADNARGIFVEGSVRNVFRENAIVGSDAAVVLYDSTTESRFVGNLFAGNLSPLAFSGRHTDTVFEGNYWSDNDAPDLDGDGRTDSPYRLSSVFDHLRGNLTAADLLSRSLAASAVAAAERTLPVLDPVPIVDRAPLARPPVLPVPGIGNHPSSAVNRSGFVTSAFVLAAGMAVMGRARSVRRRYSSTDRVEVSP
jgi:nitrous oxidase accessory protein